MWLKKLLTVFFAFTIVAAGVLCAGPADAITVGEEEELSREFLAMIAQQLDLIRDPPVVDYVNRVGKRILAHVPPQPFSYRFYVVDEPVYNAFASPAGHIFINSGLLEAFDHEEELAGILAHEIAHVTARHISDRIERSKKISAATLAGMVAGALIGPAAGAAMGQALAVGSMAAGQSMTLAYSRQDELQADQLGLQYLDSAGYSAKGLLAALQKIRSKQWFGDVPTYLMTHPASEDRMALIDTWLENHDTTSGDVDEFSFRKMQVRLVAMHGDIAGATQQYERRLKETPGDPLVQYGYGLLMARTGHRDEAIDHLKKAVAKRPFDSDFLTDLGRAYYQSGRYEQALEILQNAESLPPFDPERAYYLSQARMQTGDLGRAAWTLENLVAQRPDYTPAYYALGEVYNRMAKPGTAHYYLGVHYRQKGDTPNAVFHLNRARESSQDEEIRKKAAELLGKLQGKATKTGG
ncbi:MAG: M48 family metalloprotease [Desulfobacterales bacterium]|nr:M48 family metalloprotease [Desulfobacterales bacterium]